MSEVYFEESGEDARRSIELHVAIRDESCGGRERRKERKPAPEYNSRWRRSELQRAIDFVHGQLVLNEEVGDKDFVALPPWSAHWNADELSALGGQCVERLPSSASAEKESPEQSRAREREQSGIGAGG